MDRSAPGHDQNIVGLEQEPLGTSAAYDADLPQPVMVQPAFILNITALRDTYRPVAQARSSSSPCERKPLG